MARSNQDYFRHTESRKCLKGHKGAVKNPSFLFSTLPTPESALRPQNSSFFFALLRNLELALETVVGRG